MFLSSISLSLSFIFRQGSFVVIRWPVAAIRARVTESYVKAAQDKYEIYRFLRKQAKHVVDNISFIVRAIS